VTAAAKPPRARLRDVREALLAVAVVLIFFGACIGCVLYAYQPAK
jgi:hypothetical protein